jgi:hypothetical protein
MLHDNMTIFTPGEVCYGKEPYFKKKFNTLPLTIYSHVHSEYKWTTQQENWSLQIEAIADWLAGEGNRMLHHFESLTMRLYRYSTSNFLLDPQGRYGRDVERAKIKIISSSGVSCRAETVPSRTQRSHQWCSTVPWLCWVRVAYKSVCTRAHACRAAGQHWLLDFGGGSAEQKKIRWFPRSQSDKRDTWH